MSYEITAKLKMNHKYRRKTYEEFKLGAAQIHWLSKLVLFNFKIQYHSGKLNLAADVLNWHPTQNHCHIVIRHWEIRSNLLLCCVWDSKS